MATGIVSIAAQKFGLRGHWWFPVALAAWVTVPAGEVRFALGEIADRAQRVMAALMGMTKLDIRALEAAADAA